MERLHVYVALVAAVAVAVGASPVSSATRTLVPEVIDMGVTGRRSSGPGPAGVAGEEGEAPPHAHLTLAITAAPTALNYQHVQGGFVRSEPASSRPQDEEALQSGLTRRKRDHHQQQPADQEAEASSQAEDEAVEDDAEAAASAHDDGDMFLEPDAGAPSTTGEPEHVAAATTEDTTGQPQNLFPAFQPLFPLGHSRPPIFQVSEEPAFNQRQALLRPQQFGAFHPHASLGHHLSEAQVREPRLELSSGIGPHGFRERAYPQPAPVAAPAELQHASTMLGSGNFGVIHGGTFYGEEKEAQEYDSPSSPLHSYYGGNGHGRPAFYRGNPEPQRYRTSEDFFANFRDFADISTPTKSSFSEYYVVYVNRNASRADAGTVVGPTGVVSGGQPHLQSHQAKAVPRPNNIFERLAQIDLEHAAKKDGKDAETEVPQKKVSLGKRKLALLDKKKGGKKTATPREVPQRDAHEPLLALS
ncbi:uncharacterized protein LOC117641308 [Thrips palmi]|uniref:Uncharacterized protein LOC117641308 n=1 Tax=Thrips palmi TaxID=161013 RepID=A0A6P8YKD1_THRPL|nr:uncharacterized protein LOC117641308 [Thrips palmi]